jgi:hypothetical protein
MVKRFGAASGLAIWLITFAAQAQAAEAVQDKYRITAEERSACGLDAVSLCSDAYPDEDRLLACMKQNRVSLSATCRPVFEAGIKRRHL